MQGLASHLGGGHLGESADVQANAPDAALPAVTHAPTIAGSPAPPIVVIGIVAAVTYFVLSATLRSETSEPTQE